MRMTYTYPLPVVSSVSRDLIASTELYAFVIVHLYLINCSSLSFSCCDLSAMRHSLAFGGSKIRMVALLIEINIF